VLASYLLFTKKLREVLFYSCIVVLASYLLFVVLTLFHLKHLINLLLTKVELSQLSKDRQTWESLVAAYLGTTLRKESLTSHFKPPHTISSIQHKRNRMTIYQFNVLWVEYLGVVGIALVSFQPLFHYCQPI